MIDPLFFCGNFFEDAFGERDGCAAGSIFFLGMVNLGDGDLIVGMGGHEFGEAAVDFEEYVDADGEVASVEE